MEKAKRANRIVQSQWMREKKGDEREQRQIDRERPNRRAKRKRGEREEGEIKGREREKRERGDREGERKHLCQVHNNHKAAL